MQKELTYILGAGASFQSIPLVKSFPNRFRSFANYLLAIASNPKTVLDEYKYDIFNASYKEAWSLFKSFTFHQSFDTFFKKLFHKGDINSIRKAKKILHLYFLWEHFQSIDKEPHVKNETKFWKQSEFDKRYDALIAGLLKPIQGKAETYCPVNFITWNYDLNLFLSLKNYFSPSESIGDFMNRISSGRVSGIWKIGDNVTVINMNGYFYSSFFSSLENLVSLEKQLSELLSVKLASDYYENEYSDADAELIRFAWETHSKQESPISDVIGVAKERISMSNNIIIVGYTFPLYNRIIDFDYFNGSVLGSKTLYVQDPNASNIAKGLVSDFNLNKYNPESQEIYPVGISPRPSTILNEISDCDSFFVPSDIYKYKDSLSDIL